MRKRILSIMLAMCMVLALVPQAAFAEGETDSTPSLSTFATKQQLMDAFSSNDADNKGKLVFGKNSEGKVQEWYILGKDSGVSGDNTMIFAADSIAKSLPFRSDPVNGIPYEPSWGCVYSTDSVDAVAANHYGASDLRKSLQEIAQNESYFSSAEQSMMNATKIENMDYYSINSALVYYTTDKLYALESNPVKFVTRYQIGSLAYKVLNEEYMWINGKNFWMREAKAKVDGEAYVAYYSERKMYPYGVNQKYDARPAGNLNLTNVLFASAAGAASDGVKAGSISSGKAMTLRLDGSDKKIGTARYNDIEGVIIAQKDSNATGPVSIVVQGNDGTVDWYYSMKLDNTSETYISKGMIKVACGISDLSLDNCKIWMETTDTGARMTYAVMATQETYENIHGRPITSFELTGVTPTPGQAFPSTCQMNLPPSTHNVTYTTNDNGTDTPVTGTAEWDKTYKATIEIGTFIMYNTSICYFDSSVYVKIDGKPLPEHLSPNAYGVLTITKEFTTNSQCITGVTAPTVPTDNTFETYYGYESNASDPIGSKELGTQATVTIKNKKDNTTKNETMDVTWTIANDGGAGYDKTPGATNTFKWTIPASELKDYDATECSGYDDVTGTITGTVSIKNKVAAPVTITGTDSEIEYTGTDIDVSQYFTIDSHAGAATYSLLTGAEGGTGEGTLSGTNLSVNKTGTFKIKVNTAANGIYAEGEGAITLTVNKKSVSITAQDQNIVWGKSIDKTKYTEDGLVSGHSIKEITLTPSTAALTENGTISISGVKIENAAGEDVTGNYNITTFDGTLKISHDTALAPESIDAVKTKTTYIAGDTLNVDDITVTAHYADVYSEAVTDFTTNAATIDMAKIGDKTLTVSYSKNGAAITADITITVTGGGGGYVPPVQKPTIENDDNATISADLSNTTSTSGGTTTAIVDKDTADKIVDKAASNKSEEIVIDATAKTTTAADSTTTAQVGIPTDTLGAIAEKTEADVTVKTDVAEIKLDNTAAGAVAEQAAGDTVQIIVDKVDEKKNKVEFQLKVVCSDGNVISDFKGGKVAVTVTVPKDMAERKVVCVFIDGNGKMSKVKGQKNADGTYTFITGHFSTYALMTEEEADTAIAAQKEEILAALADQKLAARSKLVTMKNGKKAVRITWYNKNGEMTDFDGVEIYRSTKKNSGYGKKPVSVIKSGKSSYYNTAIKSGTRYYYKVRGFVIIDGQKYYTDYSLKAIRTAR